MKLISLDLKDDILLEVFDNNTYLFVKEKVFELNREMNSPKLLMYLCGFKFIPEPGMDIEISKEQAERLQNHFDLLDAC